jgi:hypothetical protein
MAMALKRKKFIINKEVIIIQEVENNSTVSQNEITDSFELPLSSLNNILLRKASNLEEKSYCGTHYLK